MPIRVDKNKCPRYLAFTAGVLVSLLLVFGVVSCKTADQYRAEADEEVYQIIDQKWDKHQPGDKGMYRISDGDSDGTVDPNEEIAARTVPYSGIITLADALEMTIAHNRSLQSQREDMYIKALELTLVRHRYQPNYFGSARGGYSLMEGDEALAVEGGVGFEQFLSTGATIGGSVAVGWMEVLSGDLRSGLNSIFRGAINQPLMRGFGRKIALESLTQAERDAVYQIRQFNRFRKEFTVDIVNKYYRILQSSGEIGYAGKNVETLNDVYQRMKKLESAGRLPRYELDQAAQDLLKARNTLIEAQTEYSQRLDAFKLDLALPATSEFELDKTELDSLMSRGMSRPNFALPEALETALSHRLDLANQADKVDDARRKIEVIADSLRAELNILAQGEALTPGDRNVDAFAGVEIDLPLDRKAERNNYRMAFIELERQKRAFEDITDSVGLQVRKGWRDLNEAIHRDQIQAEALKLAEKRFKNTWRLLQFSRASTRDVLDAQDDLFDAQIMAMEARIDYMIALLSFYRDTGVISVIPIETGIQINKS